MGLKMHFLESIGGISDKPVTSVTNECADDPLIEAGNMKFVTTTVTTTMVTSKAYVQAYSGICHHIYIPPTFYLFIYPLWKSGDSGIFSFTFKVFSVTNAMVTEVVTLSIVNNSKVSIAWT